MGSPWGRRSGLRSACARPVRREKQAQQGQGRRTGAKRFGHPLEQLASRPPTLIDFGSPNTPFRCWLAMAKWFRDHGRDIETKLASVKDVGGAIFACSANWLAKK